MRSLVTLAAVAGLLAAAGCTSATDVAAKDSSAPTTAVADAGKTLQLAFMSFAVANSYDAPMLAAAQTVAAQGNAKLTVFDANNDPQKQFSQLQNAISSGQYDGIIVQPISSTGLVDLVKEALGKGIKVVNVDQIMGPDLSTAEPQVEGLSGNVTFVPTTIGAQMGQLVTDACASKSLDPCNVGYLYNIKASSLDVAINKAFTEVISKTPSIKVVAEGESFFTPSGGLTATQNMIQAHPDLSLIVGADQGIQGAAQALAGAKKDGKVLLVGFGGSAAGLQGVDAGAWFGTVAMAPASEGRLATEALIKALREGVDSGGINPVEKDFADQGVITKANVSKFTAEWPG